MSLIKQELWLRQNAVTEEEEAYLEGGPVPDLNRDQLNYIQDAQDSILEMRAQQTYYDHQYLMDTAPTYF